MTTESTPNINVFDETRFKSKKIKIPEHYKDKTSFINDLLKFHETRGTPIANFPKIGGLGSVDLHKLYGIVTGKGGWMKVNSKDQWDEVEKEIGFPQKCINSELALKHIYIRFFDKYERYNFLGEEKERIDEDEEESRHKRWSVRTLHTIPQTYNYSHHNISDTMRVNNKLSTSLYHASEYDKLVMSLLSPLPNEQDFAINCLTLMSNECKQTLRLGRCPRLITILLAHAGIFDHYNLREMFTEFYSKIRKHSHEQFWKDCFNEKPDFLELLYEDGLSNEDVFLDDLKSKQLFGMDKDNTLKDIGELHFLALGRGLGTQDYIGQRVLQVASIMRNLSFSDDNLSILAKNRTLIRFLIMCSNIRWNNVCHFGLDILGNIATEIELKDPFSDNVSRHLFGTISDGLESVDRGVIISCMEILSKLCQNECNEDFLLRNISKKNYEQVCVYLVVNDLMLLVYTLECIYSLTTLGEKSCNSIVDIRGVVDTLVSMVTIEAHSLGPHACIQMKVVETIPSRMLAQHRQQQVQQPILQQKGNIVEQQRITAHQSPQKFTAPIVAESPGRAEQMLKQNQQQLLQENEQFALNWLKTTFELTPTLTTKIEEQEMYRMYIAASSKTGRKGVLSPIHFPRCVRSVYGGSIGPNSVNKEDQVAGEKPIFYYVGIKVRGAVIAQQVVSSVPDSKSATQDNQDSALVAQLSSKNTTQTTSLLQQVLTTNQQVTSTTGPMKSDLMQTATTTSSLIKSLLANKVAQRQFTQKQKQLSEQMNLPAATTSQSIGLSVTKPLMVGGQNQIKIGSSTLSIKPATLPNNTIITTTNANEVMKGATIEPPPLAPLSIQNIGKGMKDSGAKIIMSPASQKITANKMLVDLLDKKAPEPPAFGEKNVLKRKTDADSEIPLKRSDNESKAPSAKAADLYAELAGSILEDEEMEEELIPVKIEKKMIEMQKPIQQQIMNSAPVQRQIIMTPNNQMILSSPGSSNSQMAHQTTATIKTDSGIQTVPIILQNNSIQGLPGQISQQFMQQPMMQQQAPTQYILATNNQGQTYVVAQTQQQQMPQQILLAQTPNQQGTPTKTIIILQQPQQQQNSTIQQITGMNQQQPKIIMTPNGQQIIYSQMPRQYHQQQVIQGYPMVSSANMIGNTTLIQNPTTQTMTMANRKIVITNAGVEVDPAKLHEQGMIQKQFTTAGGAKVIQTIQQAPQQQQQKMMSQPSIQQTTSQQALQALAQGQNIIVQKGQKFQIGNTQISQVMQPMQQQQQQHQLPMQQPQQIQIIQKTVQGSAGSMIINKEGVSMKVVNVPSHTESQGMIEHRSVIVQSQTAQVTHQEILVPPTIVQSSVIVKAIEPVVESIKIEEPQQLPIRASTPSTTSSGTSTPIPAVVVSPAPATPPAKQTISIQIPVPQSLAGGPNSQQHTIKIIPSMDPSKVKDEDVDVNWPWVCDWRGCPKKKFSSANEVYLHACAIHCPNLDGNPDIYCQWGAGNSLCDNLPRKRFSLMTHIFDRHCTVEAFKGAVQKRLNAIETNATPAPKQPYPVTLIRQPNQPAPPISAETAASNLINGPTNIQNAGTAAMQAIKRHAIEFNIAKEQMEEPEGTVTKSIRLTAALILRNLVNYSNAAKRALRFHESHLAGIALSNVESNRVISQVLYEMNEQISPFSRV
ncbi:unnamed protein product [Diamesa serratosioi]